MKKILLTGSTSFIGKNILEYLEKSSDICQIIAPRHSELDLTNERAVYDLLTKENFDIVLHAAMYNKVFEHPNMLTDSLRIFFNLEKCSNLFGKMYYFGSGAEYDKTRNISSFTEENFGDSIPKNYYGFAKYIMAKQTEKSNNIYNLRLFGVYGKYEDWKTKFISNACCRALNGLPVTISKNVFFDYLYIDDLCRIVGKFIKITPKYHTYNVASGSRIDLHSIALKVVKESGKQLEVLIATPGLKEEYTASNKRMIDEINIKFTTIDDGIKYLYHWYEHNSSEVNL